MKCRAAPNCSARAFTDSPSPLCRPPVSMFAVSTSQPCSRSETRAYEVSRPPEKARTILRLLTVPSFMVEQASWFGSGTRELEAGLLQDRHVRPALGDQVAGRQQVELAAAGLDRLLH